MHFTQFKGLGKPKRRGYAAQDLLEKIASKFVNDIFLLKSFPYRYLHFKLATFRANKTMSYF